MGDLFWTAVGTPEGEKVMFMFAGAFGGLDKGADGAHELMELPLAGLARVFKAAEVPATIDYMSLDMEGAELIARKSFPFESHKILVLSVERPSPEVTDML